MNYQIHLWVINLILMNEESEDNSETNPLVVLHESETEETEDTSDDTETSNSIENSDDETDENLETSETTT